MEQNGSNSSALGFYSADGYFQPMNAITSHSLEFVSHSQIELEAMLQTNVALERYEKCAAIRDELAKRVYKKL